MLADLSRVASLLRQDTLAAAVAQRRAEIQRKLHEEGKFTFREGVREFTITLQHRREPGEQAPK